MKKKQHELELINQAPEKNLPIHQINHELTDIQNEIAHAENLLCECSDKSYSQKAWRGMIEQLNAYITEINKPKYGLNYQETRGWY